MLFSIVIPTKDRPEYLSSCLKSLYDQTTLCDNLEIIVIDDGSDERNADVNRINSEKYGAKYIKHDFNRGMAVARNTGILACKGTWLVFLDDDVRVAENWFKSLFISTNSVSDEVVGIEGKVVPSGSGVWDREVSNLTGKAYLTCHFIARAEILKRIGGFDSHFEFEGPFCEDHELVSRLLMQGKIVFDEKISVTHLPRKISLKKYLFDAPSRIRKMLNAEFYFYSRHPDRYHLFRYYKSFIGTFYSVISRHLISCLRRRTLPCLLRHPLQTSILTAAGLIEQFTAIILIPYFLKRFSLCKIGLIEYIDMEKTALLWNLKSVGDTVFLKEKQSFFRLILFKWFNKRNSILPIIKKIRNKSNLDDCKLFLRIDDVYLNRKDSLKKFRYVVSDKNISFLASILGQDLKTKENSEEIKLLAECGAEIGLHGFKHQGQFGPYHSELMQLSFPEFDNLYNSVFLSQTGSKYPLSILVPPFNGIGPEQIKVFSNKFPIICGGPETLRFTNRLAGPVFLKNGSCYFPSLYPYYSTAKKLLSGGILNTIRKCKGFICITLHFTTEEKDDFKSFRKLLEIIPIHFTPWDYFSKFNKSF